MFFCPCRTTPFGSGRKRSPQAHTWLEEVDHAASGSGSFRRADRPGPAAKSRCRGVSPRRDDALPRRDRGGQRGAFAGRLLPGEPREDLSRGPRPLREGRAGGRVRIHELARIVPAASNAGHYARIVREMATLRGLIRAGNEIARLGIDREGEATELVDRAEHIVFDLSQARVSSEFSHIEELLKDSFERITALFESGAEITGIASGFREIDHLTSGFQPGNLIVLAARPSMGKSGLG